jgi:hypothetical protein
LGDRRLRLNDNQRRRLAAKAKGARTTVASVLTGCLSPGDHPKLLMITSPPAPDSESSVTSAWRLSWCENRWARGRSSKWVYGAPRNTVILSFVMQRRAAR